MSEWKWSAPLENSAVCKINPSQVKQDSALLGFIFLHVGSTSEPRRVTPTQLYMENALFMDQMYCMSGERLW